MLTHLFALGDGWDPVRLGIAAISLSVAIAYLGGINGPAAPLRAAVKTASIATLTLLPLTYLGVPGADTTALLTLALALALSAVGDLLLALKDQSRFFVPGLASFLLAHIAYVATFLPLATEPSGRAMVVTVSATLAAGVLLGILTPRLGSLRWPVYAYFAVIMVMIVTANAIEQAAWYLGAGAVIFAFSDSLIAVRKFLAPIPYNNEAVWITYIAAQFMIAAGMLDLLLPIANR